MYTGKVSPHILKKIVISSLAQHPPNVIVGPGVGEDAAVIKNDNLYQVVASDPVTGAVKNIGYHAVYVNANDIASSGADPESFMATILLKESADENELKDIMKQINEACLEIGAYVIGGHTEIVPNLKNTIISGSMIGFTKKYISSSGARPGEKIILTKGAAIEGTSILAHEYEELLTEKLGNDIVTKAKEYSSMLSILPESRIIRKYATAMHDPTEGGISGALNELATASNCGFSVDVEKIFISDETEKISKFFSCDPLNLISSGTLLATIPVESLDIVMKELDDAEIKSSIIGTITESGRNLPMPEHDALWDVINPR